MSSRFPSTRWSLIQRVREHSSDRGHDELGPLLQQYWRPMFVHLRYKGRTDEQAEDLIQDFMVEILTGDLMSVADPSRGKFRTLLLTALDRFAISRFRYEKAAKRAPESLVSLNALESESGVAPASEASLAFERAWALDVLAEAMARMERECNDSDQNARWEVFRQRIIEPILDQSEPAEYDGLATEYGLENAKAAMNLVVTAKRQFDRVLREVIEEYVVQSTRRSRVAKGDNDGSPQRDEKEQITEQLGENYIQRQVDRELADLRDILARSGSVSELAQQFREQPQESDPVKSEYWELLTSQSAVVSPAFSDLFALIGDENLEVLSVIFKGILNADPSQLPGIKTMLPTTIGQCLRSDEPDLEALKQIKDWVNLQRFSQKDVVPRPVANGIYFLTLAVAADRCGERITGLQDTQFAAGLDWLLQQTWLQSDLRAVVERTRSSLPLAD